jgi:DamX protein
VKTNARPSLEALGLTKDPFSQVSEEFFGAGERGRQLEELRHLARWSRRLLAVTGERGVGKSTLYRALSTGLDPGVKAARINANLTSDTREVLAGIIHGFGMAAPANADPQLLIALIALHVREQIDAKRQCLVMIDDAHLLELRALEQLLKLTDSGADEGLHMVFFAEAYFVQSLDKASKRTDHVQNWHEIRLTPFSEDESRRYVAFRLAQAGLEGRPVFTQNQLSVIVGGSSGMPGRIDELASAILKGDLTISDERRWLPRMHRALVVLVVIAAGMGWLIFNGYPKGSSSAVAPVANTPAKPEIAAGEKGPRAIALPPPNARIASNAVVEHAPVEASPAKPQQSEAEPVAVEQTKRVTQELALPAAEAQPRAAAPEVIAVAAKPVSPATTAAAPVAKPAAVEAKPAVVEAKPAGQSATKQIEPPARAAAKPVQTEAAARPGLVAGNAHSAQWLRQQPPKNFTLQLFATANRAKRDEFVRQQDQADRFATFEMKRDGTIWYAVTYGSYATRAEATAAAAALPPSVGRVEPWIRTFASVQAIIE